MLIDTDALIWYLKGHPKAKKQIEKLSQFNLSTVTYIEFVWDMYALLNGKNFSKSNVLCVALPYKPFFTACRCPDRRDGGCYWLVFIAR
jgi:hypothetical protein